MINVTKTFLPPIEEYISILKRAWDKSWITNNGELVQELEEKIKEFLGVNNFLFCSNGTIVLQMALKALGITKEVITTPFSYVATTNAVLWEGCIPVFVDIRPDTFCIDESKIESAITENTQAILATHVYGLPCEVEKIDAIAKRYNLKVIYDGAHAFGCQLNGRSLLDYGDISTCSFHATKLFHTVEGGGIISNNSELNERLCLYRSFGHIGDDYFTIGLNAKNSEFHAAMGLAVFPYLDDLIEKRKKIFESYDKNLTDFTGKANFKIENYSSNYSYYPIFLENESRLMDLRMKLLKSGINTRRYFFPSLNLLPQTIGLNNSCPVSEEISRLVLCLPVYPDFTEADRVVEVIQSTLR